ncbi:purine-nucleoside phosphorylase [Rhodoferax antarcticus]|uniref:Purine nucleoside phosphorylase n=1 Tax=Rhodoferax antarcticus ANT.BR TaxID=1111071 RepID=A0A1Q8YI23_9BURK|nr:purine-nucleoside phosphorylase [Rhodoferax antarcticus]APW45267.1 purine-nucleoside phosphorylase [Rhodoferax antarcticus]MCW2311032.1 purine-nucleoside phosphorylase [Rhodoferax antarcticus]OLP07550.1 purine nucleotide phosphorylase [Rhodoferax antarcticus ANT.BR]
MNALDFLTDRAAKLQPRIAVVLGSGWAGLTEHISNPVQIPYVELNGFPQPSVDGHGGTLWLGHIGSQPVAVMSGRSHGYETGAVDGMVWPLQVLKALGCHTLVQTNAAGSLRADMPPQSLMLITDHLNLAQRSPLEALPGNDRFVSMVNAYDQELNRLAALIALAQGTTLFEGVYAWFLGPQFETPAEIRMAQLLGADAVGMSTVPETILARHLGLRVLALSFITNLGAGLSNEQLSHAHTLSQAQQGSAQASCLLADIIAALP